ncbi:DUF4250 domain-containing protein [Marinomonas sp. C2222]|uniref:DUF4250 domain-containing protein n=1 Tax=Marinomonas sargassi TaxID=2984494 RepID=A0ABT2YR94_9GAMM|nr:DUF4250 domain-containing protein [Marinomonas sargassi]MCV2402405.1 DUF4250 domain-containing protein [Marinomonas sargassi]
MLSANNLETIDFNILFSVVNMKLRDEFSSVKSLCSSFELDEKILMDRLKKHGYVYAQKNNQFIKSDIENS